MSIDVFWEQIFSEDTTQVLSAWKSLATDERRAVFSLLRKIERDPERITAQRSAATFAQNSIRTYTALPEGALAFARHLAHETGQILKSRFGATTSSLKGDGSLVTESDMESDGRISAAIAERFPGHSILSEERLTRYGGEEWAWIIDPIDGTTNFTRGFPCWGVLLALLHFGQPVLAVADFPALAEHYYAVAGGGVFLNDTPVHAITPTLIPGSEQESHHAQIFVACSRSVAFGVPVPAAKLRISGSTGYDLALVASGVALGAIEQSVYAWDIATGWLFIAESHGAQLSIPVLGDFFPLQPDFDCGSQKVTIIAAVSQKLIESLQLFAAKHWLSD
jgi:myo-inositol-1(or 4)-monophosphatase